MAESLIKTAAVAKLLGVTPKTVINLVKREKLRATRLPGGIYLFDPGEVEEAVTRWKFEP